MNFHKITLLACLIILSHQALAKEQTCRDLRKSYESLCQSKHKTAEACLLKGEKPILKTLSLIEKSPQLTQEDMDASKNFYAAKAPTKKEIELEITRELKNCWTSVHYDMWRSVLVSFDGKSEKVKQQAKEVLQKRNALPDNASNIGGLLTDVDTLIDAGKQHLIAVPNASLQDLDALKADLVEKGKEFNSKWLTVLPPTDASQVHKNQNKETKYDTVGMVKVMTEEHNYHVQQRQKLQQWVKDNLK